MKIQLRNLIFLNPVITSLEDMGYKRKIITVDNESMINEIATLSCGRIGNTETVIYFVDDNYQTVFQLNPFLTIASVLAKNKFAFSKIVCLKYHLYTSQGWYDDTIGEYNEGTTAESYSIIVYEFAKTILEKIKRKS